jgi:NAD(P)H-hydrate epimerase
MERIGAQALERPVTGRGFDQNLNDTLYAMNGLRSHLPTALYRAAQVRELDRIAIEEAGIPGSTLMERAGTAAFSALRAHWPAKRCIAVVCGVGNNAGDGFVLARLAGQAGLQVGVYQVGDAERLKGDALAAAEAWRATGGSIQTFAEGCLAGDYLADAVVDALFGTGLDREVEGPWRTAVEAMNGSRVPVLAIDIPSGLHADSGRVLGVAVRARVTVTFIGLKQGLFTGQGPDRCGEVLFDDLRVPPSIYEKTPAASLRLTWEELRACLAPRQRTAHKGHFGHVLVVGGDHGMSGAARMAGEAAARVGVGLVSIATRAAHASYMNIARPELMCHGIEGTEELAPLLERANVVALGPGLGRSDWAKDLLDRALATDKPLVVDADALNLLAEAPRARGHWVLTPHPGEAARLLGRTTAEVEHDRFRAVDALRRRFGGVCVLKGAGTLIAGEDGAIALCTAGNPGMASGGMGDLLTGVIAGWLAQGFGLSEAAQLGVCIHALAGDRAARERGERGMLASDLLPYLRGLANPQ